MRIAYADPPYPGQAHLYKRYRKDGHIAEEVDHTALIAYLGTFDAWALSTSSRALRDVLDMCPSGVRVAAWVRTRPALKRGIYPTDAWEPVLYKPLKRKQPKGVLYDWLAADTITGALAPSKHIIGRKPEAFSIWVFRMLRAAPGDEFVDVFPGSGAVTRAWKRYSMMRELLSA